MTESNEDFDARVGPRPKPVQFSLRSLMLYIAVSALLLGLAKYLGMGFGFALFAIGFIAFMALVAGLMLASPKGLVVVHEAGSGDEAALCRDYLRENGVPAVIDDGELPGLSGLRTKPSEVLVPSDRLLEAEELLAAGPLATGEPEAAAECPQEEASVPRSLKRPREAKVRPRREDLSLGSRVGMGDFGAECRRRARAVCS